MDSWDSKTVLDKYIYNYMKKKNLHTTAEIFRAEADISPNDVSIDSDEGFLTEWWRIFWSTYSSRTTEIENKEVPPENLLVPSSDFSDPMFDKWPAVPPGFPPLPPRVSPSVMVPGPRIGSFRGGSDSPRMMPTPGLRFPTSNFKEPSRIGCSDAVPKRPVPVPGPGPATLIPVADLRGVREHVQFRVPINNSDFNPESDRVSSPTECSHAQKNKKGQICVTRDNKRVAVEPKTEPLDISDASISEQGHFGVPQMDLDYNSQILNVGQLTRLVVAPAKFNYPHQNANRKKSQCCANKNEGHVDSTLRRSVPDESTHQAPK